jgi:glycosyltransferase involved in cell wall biosynthesis
VPSAACGKRGRRLRRGPADDADDARVPVIAEVLFSYQIGGSERVGVDLAVEFKRRGYQVVCFAVHDSDGPMRVELERAGIRCLELNYDRYTGIGVLRRLRYMWACWRLLRRERISALHVHHTGSLVLCGIPARLARVPRIVLTEHAVDHLKELPRWRIACYCRAARDITVVEPAQAQYFHSQFRVPRDRLHHVANGTRLRTSATADAIRHAREKLALGADEFAYIYVGRLSPEKDLGTLLEAFATLPADVRDRSRLYLVGDGSERASLETRRDSLGLLARVTLLGARSDVAEILTAADAFVMSSRSEGLPMVLLEAMVAGVPCVATAVGGIPGLFGGDRGVCVRPQDSAALAAAMASIARSPELRARLVANALDHVRKHHAFDAIVDRYLHLLGLPPRVERAGTLKPAASPGTG